MKQLMLNVTFGLLLVFAAVPAPAATPSPSDGEKMALWSKQAPIGDGKFETTNVVITLHRPEKPNGTAVVICPGGGYGGLVVGAEGHGIARWLNSNGITGVVLQYRLPAGRSFVPLLDAQQAIRFTRAHAAEWNIQSNRIGIIGFSAGGHLASTAATHFDAGDPKSEDPVARVSCRPDFAILIYPVVTMGQATHKGTLVNLLGANPSKEKLDLFSNEKQVSDNTPPVFLAHAKDDILVPPDNSRKFQKAMNLHGIPCEYLELPEGGHGLNGYKGPMWDAWQKRSLAWLAEQNLVALPTNQTGSK